MHMICYDCIRMYLYGGQGVDSRYRKLARTCIGPNDARIITKTDHTITVNTSKSELPGVDIFK